MYLCAARRTGQPPGCDPSDFDSLAGGAAEKRDITLKMLKELPCHTPRGAFYVFPDVTRFLKNGEGAEDLAAEILQRVHVAVTPGEAFGGNGHIRICYAIEEDRLIPGLERIEQVIHERIGENQQTLSNHHDRNYRFRQIRAANGRISGGGLPC